MGDIYHVLNRGVDKREIFLDKQDYFRFIHDLFVFNDKEILNTTFRSFQRINKDNDIEPERKSRKLLVDIHAFCLMPNHYHLLLSPKIEKGIAKFMHKLDMGYSKYFNAKHKRKGTLFEGNYKSILVTKESHFSHLPYYIHFNPLDLKFPEWRDGKLRKNSYKKAMEFLNSYRLSSHLDYIGTKNLPSVSNRTFLTKILGKPQEYKQNIKQWLKDLELEGIKELILE